VVSRADKNLAQLSLFAPVSAVATETRSVCPSMSRYRRAVRSGHRHRNETRSAASDRRAASPNGSPDSATMKTHCARQRHRGPGSGLAHRPDARASQCRVEPSSRAAADCRSNSWRAKGGSNRRTAGWRQYKSWRTGGGRCRSTKFKKSEATFFPTRPVRRELLGQAGA